MVHHRLVASGKFDRGRRTACTLAIDLRGRRFVVGGLENRKVGVNHVLLEFLVGTIPDEAFDKR
jgi:hypothetical protein